MDFFYRKGTKYFINNKLFFVPLRLSLYLFLVIISFACKEKKATPPTEEEIISEDFIEEVVDTVPRTSITFIMGKDVSEYNQYYALAGHYYRLNPEDKTEIVIDSLKSILEVCKYLQTHQPENERPYGLINLVSHGNEFVDLSARVYPKGLRTSVKTLQKALQDSIFVPLDITIVDSKTLISLHGCAVGNNAELLTYLAMAFGSQQNKVKVRASKLFEYYAYLSKNKNPQSVQHYFAKAWYVFYHPDSIPNVQALVQQLTERYPGEHVNWETGLQRRFQSNPSEIYHFSFVVPVTWNETYESESAIPALNSKAKRSVWLSSNQDFFDLLQQTDIPQEYFQFRYYRSKYTQDEKDSYVLSVKARATVICLIQPLIAEDDNNLFTPFRPAEDDSLFFAFSKSMTTP
jgi:hypothetical protein